METDRRVSQVVSSNPISGAVTPKLEFLDPRAGFAEQSDLPMICDCYAMQVDAARTNTHYGTTAWRNIRARLPACSDQYRIVGRRMTGAPSSIERTIVTRYAPSYLSPSGPLGAPSQWIINRQCAHPHRICADMSARLRRSASAQSSVYANRACHVSRIAFSRIKVWRFSAIW
jgi:hypothetical protein